MEGLKVAGPPERPQIPDILIEATTKAIKDGMKMDEFARAMANQNQAEKGEGFKVIKKKKHKSERKLQASVTRKGMDDDEAEVERTYRNLDERRMGFLIIGDQHRFTGKEMFIYPSVPPLDFSFCMINRIEEIVTEREKPQNTRSYRNPVITSEERYKTSAIRLSYNVIDSIDGLVNVLFKILEGGPQGLCWIDLSFNAISKFDEDTLSQLPNLKILNMHGNSIQDMTEIPKLKALTNLQHLTLHGNPLEQEEAYRIAVIYYLPELQHLDYIAVTKSDKANSNNFGKRYERYWDRRHIQIELNNLSRKKAADVSYTQRVMEGADDFSDDEDDQPKKRIIN